MIFFLKVDFLSFTDIFAALFPGYSQVQRVFPDEHVTREALINYPSSVGSLLIFFLLLLLIIPLVILHLFSVFLFRVLSLVFSLPIRYSDLLFFCLQKLRLVVLFILLPITMIFKWLLQTSVVITLRLCISFYIRVILASHALVVKSGHSSERLKSTTG